MKHLLKPIKNKYLRASARSGLKSAGALPTSGFTTVDNSTGASQAAAELSAQLDIALEEINFEDNPRAQLTAELERLDSKAAEYANSSLASCASAEPWDCTRTEAKVIALAWDCAEAAYDKEPAHDQRNEPESPSSKPRLDFSLPSSITGSVKATTCTMFTLPPYDNTKAAGYMIIAVRGSASKVDQIVNFNGEPRDATVLFEDANVKYGDLEPPRITLLVHSGFLNCAVELMRRLSAPIESRVKQNPKINLLFTGHSSGGAVASLLYLAFRVKLASIFPEMTFSCISFGCPPIAKYLHREDRIAFEKLMSDDLVLNIVNEYDLVARAERRYIHSLIQLYQSVGPPEPIRHSDCQYKMDTGKDHRPLWALPEPEVQHMGTLVVLKIGPPISDMQGIMASFPRGPILSAWRIAAEDLSGLIFCRLSVHSRVVYRERIQQIEQGCFGGRIGWSAVLQAWTP